MIILLPSQNGLLPLLAIMLFFLFYIFLLLFLKCEFMKIQILEHLKHTFDKAQSADFFNDNAKT